MNNSLKFNLVIDGNYFLFRTLHSTTWTKGYRKFEKEHDRGVFVRKFATDLTYQIRKWAPYLNSVIFAKDGRSWRKDYDEDYKANRVPDETVDWEQFSKTEDLVLDILKEKGIPVVKVAGFEGDDICMVTSMVGLDRQENTLVMSGDGDLLQLVDYDFNNDSITLVTNPVKNNLYANQDFDDFIRDFNITSDIFNQASPLDEAKKGMIQFMNTEFTDYLVIDPYEKAMNKIIQGDKGDNVPNLKRGIGVKTAEKLTEKIREYMPDLTPVELLFDAERELVAKLITENIKGAVQDDIFTNLETNTRLTLLKREVLPEGMIENGIAEVSTALDEAEYNQVLNKIQSMKLLLKGTDFFDDEKFNVAPTNMDPFANFNIPTSDQPNTNELF